MARLLGIDLGSASVKLVLYEGSMRRFLFKGAWARPVAQDLGTPPTEEAREAALRGLLADVLPTDLPPILVMGFPTEHASARLVTLPFSDRAQVDRALPYEVEGMVPFDLDDMVLTSRILELKPGQSRVLAVLADRAAVRQELALLERVGVNPRHLVLDADLLAQYATRGVQAVVDFGHSRTIIAFCQDGQLIGARAIERGGREATAALAQAFGLSWEVATDYKHQLPLAGALSALAWEEDESTSPRAVEGGAAIRQLAAQDPSARDVATDGPQVLRNALEPLLADLRASLIAFEDAQSLGVDEVLVCGGGAEQQGLVELLRANLGVIVRSLVGEDEEQDPRKTGALALALGRRSVQGARGHELDLRQGEFAWKGDITAYAGYALYGALGIAAMVMLGIAFWGWQSYALSRQRAEIEAQIASTVLAAWPDAADPERMKDPSTAIAIATEKATEEQAQVDALSGVISEVPPTLNMLREISDGVPAPGEAKVDVTELTINDESITLRIDTDGFESATQIENSLKMRPMFSSAQGGDSKKVGDIVRFTVTIPLAATAQGEEG